MQTEVPTREFRPELLSRRGEMTGWGLALLVGATWIILVLTGQRVIPVLPFLAIILFLAALSISFGNWMDRRTVLRLDSAGVTFDNGLRHVRLGWDEIRQIQVFPSNWGKKVRVIGTKAHFEFRTLGEVKVQGEVKGRLGFAEGELILRTLVEAGDLEEALQNGPGPGDARYYYARE